MSEREISKPAILGAPYDLSPENQESQEELRDKFFHPEENVGINDGLVSDPVEQIGGLILNFQRRLDILEDNLAKMFKQIGHADGWNRLINS